MNWKAFLLTAFVLPLAAGAPSVEVVPVPPGRRRAWLRSLSQHLPRVPRRRCEGDPRAPETISTVSTLIPLKSDAELVAFVKTGRMMNDPMNKTGIAMPPYGSNPKLTDQEIVDAIVYIRSLAVDPQPAANGSDEEENCS